MEQIIGTVISVLFSAASGVIAVCIALGKYREKVDRLEEYKSKINDLEKQNEKNTEKISQLEKREEKINQKTDQYMTDIAALSATVGAIQRVVDRMAGVSDAHSPLALTDKGWNLVKDSGAFEIYETIKEELLAELELEDPRSQYEVQEKARWMLGNKLNDDRFAQVEDWAFKNGEDLAQILRALAIPLRDFYFEKHPEIIDNKEKY